MISHPFDPVYDADSEILILGSFPSVKSRENNFYYGHPQNRFWKVLASVFQAPVPQSVPDKIRFLHERRIALWDVIASCEITGSADTAITNAVPNDLAPILLKSRIGKIYVNGKTAQDLYDRYCSAKTGIPAAYLPSTSPANAAWSLERLIDAWRIVAL